MSSGDKNKNGSLLPEDSNKPSKGVILRCCGYSTRLGLQCQSNSMDFHSTFSLVILTANAASGNRSFSAPMQLIISSCPSGYAL
jgi:hypothetical protein